MLTCVERAGLDAGREVFAPTLHVAATVREAVHALDSPMRRASRASTSTPKAAA